MAQKGVIIEKPNDIKNWLILGNFVDAVLVDFQLDKWDADKKEFFIEVEYIPTEVMIWLERMDYSKEKDWDRVTATFKSTYPMDMVGHIEPRTEGTRILMLCNYKGEKCNIFEKINTNLLEQNRKQRTDINNLNSIIIGMNADIRNLLNHPQEFRKKIFKEMENMKKSFAPAILNTGQTGVDAPPPSGGEEGG